MSIMTEAGTEEQEKEGQLCPFCQIKGLNSKLVLLQVSLDEAFLTCEDNQCSYPMALGTPINDFFIPRNHTEINHRRKRRSSKGSCSSVHSLQLCSNSISRMCQPQFKSAPPSPMPFSDSVEDHLMDCGSELSQTTPANVVKALSNVTSQLQQQKSTTHRPTATRSSASSTYEGAILQWSNSGNLCWLDVALALLVHNLTLKQHCSSMPSQSLIKKVYDNYWLAVGNLRCGSATVSEAVSALEEWQKLAFAFLEPGLKCELGRKDSPIFALPLLLQEDPAIHQNYLSDYHWQSDCTSCGHSQQKSMKKVVVTFPNTPSDFSMKTPCFTAKCANCNAPTQKNNLVFDRAARCLMFHFVEGLAQGQLERLLGFEQGGRHYRVSAVILYQRHPDHFVLWIKNLESDEWTECNDLRSPVCYWKLPAHPTLPPDQIHLVVWEQSLPPSSVTTGDRKEQQLHPVPAPAITPLPPALGDGSRSSSKRRSGTPIAKMKSSSALANMSNSNVQLFKRLVNPPGLPGPTVINKPAAAAPLPPPSVERFDRLSVRKLTPKSLDLLSKRSALGSSGALWRGSAPAARSAFAGLRAKGSSFRGYRPKNEAYLAGRPSAVAMGAAGPTPRPGPPSSSCSSSLGTLSDSEDRGSTLSGSSEGKPEPLDSAYLELCQVLDGGTTGPPFTKGPGASRLGTINSHQDDDQFIFGLFSEK